MDEPVQQHDVPASSPLASLREKVQRAREASTVDLPIADIDVVIRFRAVDFDVLDRNRNPGKRRDPLAANAAVLIDACVGVFTCTDDGTLVSVDPDDPDTHIDDDDKVIGQPVTFSSPRLAELLGVDTGRAADVVAALYPRQLETARHADAVIALSRGDADQLAELALGN